VTAARRQRSSRDFGAFLGWAGIVLGVLGGYIARSVLLGFGLLLIIVACALGLSRRRVRYGPVLVAIVGLAGLGVTAAAVASLAAGTPQSGDAPGINVSATLAGSCVHPPANERCETTGGPTHTWVNYKTARGTPGPMIAPYSAVAIPCRTRGYKVHNGNVWWYRIGSQPWSGHFYASADAFYNNGSTAGSLRHTPFVDLQVRLC
jgi:hypothetical protein